MQDTEGGWSSITSAYYFWDIVTLICGMISVFGFLALLAWLLGLPGRIAVARQHPEAEAVYAMGWAGFLAVIPWIQAFIWAFKPTDVIDIRRYPDEEREAIKSDLARLKAYAYGAVDEPAKDAVEPSASKSEREV